MGQIQGMRDTLDILQQRRVYDVEKKIFLLKPNQTPISAIISAIGTRKLRNPEFSWHEDALIETSTQKSGTSLASVTALVVDDATIFGPSDVLEVTQTGEKLLVISKVDSTNTLTVTRGACGTTPATITDNDELLKVGTAFAEGTTSPAAITTEPSRKYNYAQIMKETVDMTETEAESEMTDERDEAYQIAKKAEEFNRNRERAFLFGTRYEETTGGKPRRFTNGICKMIATNIKNMSGASVSTATINAWLKDVFQNGDSDERWVFASPSFMQAVANLAMAKLQLRMDDSTFGLAVYEWISPYGRTLLKMHRELIGATYGAYAIALDVQKVKRCVFRPVKLMMNVQANDSDSRKHQYISEEGVQLVLEKCHGIYKNFATA